MPNYGATGFSRFRDAVDGDLPDPTMGKDVILAACDGNYFNLFSVDLILSMERLGVRQSLHIHLLEPPKRYCGCGKAAGKPQMGEADSDDRPVRIGCRPAPSPSLLHGGSVFACPLNSG